MLTSKDDTKTQDLCKSLGIECGTFPPDMKKLWVLVEDPKETNAQICDNTIVFEQIEHAQYYADTYEHAKGYVPMSVEVLEGVPYGFNWSNKAQKRLEFLTNKQHLTTWDKREIEMLSELFPKSSINQLDYQI